MPRHEYYIKNKQKLADIQRKTRQKKRIERDPCLTFRLMMSGKILRDPFFCENHILSGCESCQKWYHEQKKQDEPIEGAKIW